MDQAPVYGWSLLEAIRELFPSYPHLFVLAAGLSDNPLRAIPVSPQLRSWQGEFWAFLSPRLRSGELIARGARFGQPNKEAIPVDFFDAATADFQAGTVTAHGLTFGSVRLFRPEVASFSGTASPPAPLPLRDHTDADVSTSAVEPQPSASPARLRIWYQARIDAWQPGDLIPTEAADLGAARIEFGREHRTTVHALRHELAPSEWNVRKTGKKPIPH